MVVKPIDTAPQEEHGHALGVHTEDVIARSEGESREILALAAEAKRPGESGRGRRLPGHRQREHIRGRQEPRAQVWLPE